MYNWLFCNKIREMDAATVFWGQHQQCTLASRNTNHSVSTQSCSKDRLNSQSRGCSCGLRAKQIVHVLRSTRQRHPVLHLIVFSSRNYDQTQLIAVLHNMHRASK